MDQTITSDVESDPAILAILERTSGLTADEVYRLAQAYQAPAPPRADGPPIDRRRVADLARRRSGLDLRGLEADVMRALGAIGEPKDHRRLVQLGLVDAAERAIIDAIVSVALRDRLGAPEAAALRAPWESVA